MLRYSLKRLLSLVISLAVASLVIFFVIEVAPGDPASFMLGINAQPDTVAALRTELGLDVGKVVYGNVGAPDRLDFTVLGSAVNRAARIENLTKEAGCSLLVSEQFASQLGDSFCWQGDYRVPGVEVPLSVFCANCENKSAGPG